MTPNKRHCPECQSELVEFSHTREDWYDGDEDDWYKCLSCGNLWSVYIPR